MAWPDFTYDIYEDFEDALSASWVETDTESLIDPNDASAKYYGAKGCSISLNNTAVCYVGYQDAERTLSVGFWFYASALPSNAAFSFFCWGRDQTATGTYNIKAYYVRATGPIYTIKLRGAEGAYSGAITLTGDTWYWCTINMVKNATSTLRVYGTDKAQVGTDVTVAAGNNAADCYLFGNDTVLGIADAIYIDDFVVDYTDATFPLLGWEAAATSSTSWLKSGYWWNHPLGLGG